MHATYTVEALSSERIDQAYPLAHAIEPSLGLADWRRRCGSLNPAGRDAQESVLIVTAATRRFYALCTVAVVVEPGARVLTLSRLIIGHAIDVQAVGKVLLQALVDYARDAGCALLRIEVTGSDQPALRALDNARLALDIGLPIELV